MRPPPLLQGLGGPGGFLESPTHIPAPLVSVLYNVIPIAVLTFGFWDQYSDFMQSQNIKAYQANYIEEYDFVIGKYLGISETVWLIGY